MTASDCPYCQRRSRRPNEATCGTPWCIDQHVSLQADRAEANQGDLDNAVLVRGYRCDRCGHEQEADVACDACGNHGVVPFGFSDTVPDAVRDTAALYDSAVSPGEEERLREARKPRPGCKHCRLIGELCGFCERLGTGPLAEPSALAQQVAAGAGLDAHTVQLVFDIERLLARHGLARQQYALASALWRSVSQHPSLRMTADFTTSKIVLTEGGRRIAFEADVFPPEPVPGKGKE